MPEWVLLRPLLVEELGVEDIDSATRLWLVSMMRASALRLRTTWRTLVSWSGVTSAILLITTDIRELDLLDEKIDERAMILFARGLAAIPRNSRLS